MTAIDSSPARRELAEQQGLATSDVLATTNAVEIVVIMVATPAQLRAVVNEMVCLRVFGREVFASS